ncbi:anaphase-promoting complex subunit 1 isoform X2 [Silene latifolia]|uniref:anaphase-promoting complex subunit 1 isoform X2 n=1 Tax=Silene latifolia TaxID=37657 RepID=UPI003D76FA0D
MSVGERELIVLGEFKPFGLIAEALDGEPPEISNGNNVVDKYDYFLFDSELIRERDHFDFSVSPPSPSSSAADHEIFIRGNRIMWIAGSRVYKRFTLSSTIIMACWCHMAHSPEAVLCVLQVDALTIFSASGELRSIPLPGMITSIWPLPFGLLLQQAAEGNPPLSSSPFLSARDISLSRREVHLSPQQCLGFPTMNHIGKANLASVSSHLILNDPLEEPQPTFVGERGEVLMKDFDERTIWSSERIPLIASYNREKMQHSLWLVECVSSCSGQEANSSSNFNGTQVFPKQFSFRIIWKAKGSRTAATKVFLATDENAAPIICLLFQEQRSLLCLRLQVEKSDDILVAIKTEISWSIQAVAAEPVSVFHPRVKVGALSSEDILVLDPENTVYLYSGKQRLCKYILSSHLDQHWLEETYKSPENRSTQNTKIIGLADAVGSRINVILSNGQMIRCALRRGPSCSLTTDCIVAMSEGLSSPFYNHFLKLLWGNYESADLSNTDSNPDSEWDCFKSIILQLCGKSQSVSLKESAHAPHSSWEFLINSEFHKNYCARNFFTGAATVGLDVKPETYCFSLFNNMFTPEELSMFLTECLDSLHAVYENLKLINLRKRDLERLVILLSKSANLLGEESYVDYYIRDFPFLSKKLKRCSPSSPRSPPSLYRWLESCLVHGLTVTNINDIPPLVRSCESSAVSWSRKVVSFYSLFSGASCIGKKLSSGVFCNIALGSSSTSEEKMVLAMVGENFGLQQLDLLPIGVSLPLRHVIDKCRESSPTGWPAAAYVLLGREDMALSSIAYLNKHEEPGTQTNRHVISMSAPYMLQLQPVTIPSTISDTIGMDTLKYEDVNSSDDSIIDGMEHLFNSSTQLRYGRDLRLNEVRRLLCSARPVAIQTSTNHTASDQDVQQAQLWLFAQRTTALPFGRGAFTLATSCTLLTEALTVPKLVLAGRLPAQQNATVNLDPNIRNIQELRAWPEFHNAVAAGLRLSPFQGKMSRTWIRYNRPEEPNATHAGLLLALGLHGHLTVLSISDIFHYYSEGHESTTVGLMLGLAASYRGTMEPTVFKSFYVHLPARHPSSFPELEVPTLLQSAALMSVGLIFEGSSHPQTMQMLLGEIGRRSGGDNVLEREGYALSAGFSLGLIALGHGEDKFAFMDTLVDRLFQYAGENCSGNSLLNPVTDENCRGAGQMLDGVPVNVDVTAPGAIIALALMFLKTESEVIVSRLSIPRTNFELQYLRPDFIMLRVIARNLIMWSRVNPTKEWVESQIPEIVKNGVEALGDDIIDMEGGDEEAVVQAYVNIVTGACISLGLKYAGSRNGNAQELLHSYVVYFLNEIKPVSTSASCMFPRGLSKFVDRSTLEICLHLAVLSLAMVMAGSGNLQTLRLLRFLRNRNSSDGQANFGIQMTVSLAIGFLFLGGGMRSFSTSKSSIAALLATLYPRFPTGPNDNRCHLQAYRHLYVLATEARWIQTVDVDTGLPVYAPLDVTIKETQHHAETSICEVTPCILPERAILKSVRVCGPRYWAQVIELTPQDKPWWNFGDKNHPFNSGILYIKRKVGACSYVDDPVGCQSLLSRAMNKAFRLKSTGYCAPSMNPHTKSGSSNVAQLVSTFSSDPSLIAFAQLCCDSSWNNRSDVDFQEFCLQVLFECVSKDRPALLQVYMSLYTMIKSMSDQVTQDVLRHFDSLSMANLKLVVAYNEALLRGRLTSSREGIIQPNFLGSLRKRIEDLFRYSHELEPDVHKYLISGNWPNDKMQDIKRSNLLSWYLQWYCVPSPSALQATMDKIKHKTETLLPVPLLRLAFPHAHIRVISEINKLLSSG